MTAELVPADRLVGQTLAERYQVLHRLGEGAMGVVYKARHVKVGRTFAVKVLHSRLLQDTKVAQRFDREAELAGRLRHANVVGVVDVGEVDGLRYMVMDFAEGPDLAQLLVEAPMPPARIIHLVRQMLEGLFHAHEQGLIHRDFKPENVIIERDSHGAEMPRIVDFGIAILRDGGDATDGQGRLTTNGLVLGTPHYMAPEQAVADPIDHRIDLFALGIVIYEMLSGRLPFDGSGAEVARANLLLDPPPISKRVPHLEVDPLLEAFARKMMAKKPKDRPANAKAARELLDLIDDDRAAAAAALGVAGDLGGRLPAETETMATQPRAPISAEPLETQRLRATPSPNAPFPPAMPAPLPFATGAPRSPFVDYQSAPHQAPPYGGYEQTPPPQAFPSYDPAAPQAMPMAYSAPHLNTPDPMHAQTSVRMPLSWPPKPEVKRKPPWLVIGVVAGSLGVALGAILALPGASKPEAPVAVAPPPTPVAQPVAPKPPTPAPTQAVAEQHPQATPDPTPTATPAPPPTPTPAASDPEPAPPQATAPIKPTHTVKQPKPTPIHVAPKLPEHTPAAAPPPAPLDPMHVQATPAPLAPAPAPKPIKAVTPHRTTAGLTANQLSQLYSEVGRWVFGPDAAKLSDGQRQDLQTRYRMMPIQSLMGASQDQRDNAAVTLDEIAVALGH